MSGRACVAFVLLVCMIPLILGLGSPSYAASAGVHPVDCRTLEWTPPPGAVVWALSDFEAWLMNQDGPTRAWGERQLQRLSSCESNQATMLVFRRSDYEKWEATLPVEIRSMLAQTGHIISVGQLPGSLATELPVAACDDSGEVVLVPLCLKWCPICAAVLMTIVGWALGRFVYDRIWDWMTANWEEWVHCEFGHLIEKEEATDYHCCRYCAFGELALEREWGTGAKVWCVRCHGLFTISNPLY